MTKIGPGGGTVWEKMAQQSPDMLCTLDPEEHFRHTGGACKDLTGYESAELAGRHYSTCIAPEDLATARQALQEVRQGHDRNFHIRLIHKDGHPVPVCWYARWDEADEAFYCVLGNSKASSANSLESELKEKQYQALFQDNADILLLETPQGLIIEVNESFCRLLNVSREAALNRPFSSFVSTATAVLCEKSFRLALAGNTARVNLELLTPGKDPRTFEISRQPIMLEGQVHRILTTARDITPLTQAFNTIQRQTTRLHNMFESITDAFFMLDRNWRFTYINQEFGRILNLDKQALLGKNIWEAFPKEVGGTFYQHYHQALETGKAVHFDAYFKDLDRWLHVRAYPSPEGLSVYFDDITESIRSRQELEKLSLVASHTTNGVIITDSERRIEWANEAYMHLTGYSAEELLGQVPSDLLIRDETSRRSFEKMKSQMISGQPVSFEVLLTRKTGEAIWTLVQVNPIFDETGKLVRYITIHTDITDRVKWEDELKMLSLVANKTNNSVLIADKAFCIEWVNAGFTRLFGYTLMEVMGKKPSEILHTRNTDKQIFQSLEHKLLQGESISFEILNHKKNGEEIWLSVEISPVFDDKGELSRFVEVQTDITALKKSELELAELAKDLYRQNSDLQQFTYIISHNFRAPVANALGLADLLTQLDKQDEAFEASLSYLKKSILQLDSVLRDMNTILSIRDSKGSLDQEEINIRQVIDQVQLSMKEALQECGAQVSVEAPPDFHVKANKAYLYSIFYNLLSNAIRYRDENRPLQVHISCATSTRGGALITFSDNGMGLDMKKASGNIFRLYKRFHPQIKGRGIGLYLVKSHVEAMGGHITVTSQLGQGTTFTIYLG